MRRPITDAPKSRWVFATLALVTAVGIVFFHFALSSLLASALTAEPIRLATSLSVPTLIGVAIIGILLRLAALICRDQLGQRLSLKRREERRAYLLQSAHQAGPARTQAMGNSAWWTQRVVDQIDALHGLYARYQPCQINAVIIPLTLIAVASAMDWIGGLLLLLATPLIPIFMALIGMGTESLHRAQQDQQASLAAHFSERLQNLPWLRRVGASAITLRSIADASERYRQVGMRVLRVAFLSSAALEFFSAIAIALLAIYVGFSLAGYITFGPAAHMSYDKGLMLLLLAPECFLSLRQLALAHHEKSAAEAADTTLIELHNRLARPHAPRAIAPDQESHSALILNHVEFSYAENNAQATPLIHDFSLTVIPGELVALKGDSGVGKSTLLHLVAGFLSPAAGCINRPISIAWLGQRSRLFYGTLRDNLQRAQLNSITDEAMTAALAEVGLDLGSVDLPDGLDTVIRERHQGISSGQAQRIAMARCLLQDARLWLLDEPTSALDEAARTALWATLKRLVSKHRIVALVATHDPEVERHATRTIALAITHPRRRL